MGATISVSDNFKPLYIQHQGLYSLSGKTSYRKISWRLEAQSPTGYQPTYQSTQLHTNCCKLTPLLSVKRTGSWHPIHSMIPRCEERQYHRPTPWITSEISDTLAHIWVPIYSLLPIFILNILVSCSCNLWCYITDHDHTCYTLAILKNIYIGANSEANNLPMQSNFACSLYASSMVSHYSCHRLLFVVEVQWNVSVTPKHKCCYTVKSLI